MGTGGRGDKLGRERLWLIVLWRVEVTVETTTTGSQRGQGDLNKLLPGGEEGQQRGGGAAAGGVEGGCRGGWRPTGEEERHDEVEDSGWRAVDGVEGGW
jgi:hypothetical protein